MLRGREVQILALSDRALMPHSVGSRKAEIRTYVWNGAGPPASAAERAACVQLYPNVERIMELEANAARTDGTTGCSMLTRR